MKILKFGGKSLATKEKMLKICKFIKRLYQTEKQIIVVVSAMGFATDGLLNLANEFNYKKNENQDRELARLLSTGELQSASLFSMMLLSLNVPSKSFSAKELEISTFGGFLDAKISYINKTKLVETLKENTVAVVAGFQGVSKDGEITTLGRGGSDTTAVALGAVFGEQVEIFSDYDGIFAGDPKLDNYKKCKTLNYEAVISMADAGAKVLDSRASTIAKDFQTIIISKSSMRPELSGTIVGSIEKDNISITAKQNLAKITIVFSNATRSEKIAKSVLKIISKFFYTDFELKKNKLQFFCEQKDFFFVSSEISKSLKLLKP